MPIFVLFVSAGVLFDSAFSCEYPQYNKTQQAALLKVVIKWSIKLSFYSLFKKDGCD